MTKSRILIKLSGELFSQTTQESGNHTAFNVEFINDIIRQIKQLRETHIVGIVVGGGNLFRGGIDGKRLGLPQTTADYVGMTATLMNGLIVQDLLERAGISAQLFSAIHAPQLARSIEQHTLEKACKQETVLLFAGGSGDPFFTTDTAAVLRGLQMGAGEVWKATKVDGVYDEDPTSNPEAKLLPHLTFEQVLERRLQVMDLTAITLAHQHGLTLRVFNVFTKDALINAAHDPKFGSTISKE